MYPWVGYVHMITHFLEFVNLNSQVFEYLACYTKMGGDVLFNYDKLADAIEQSGKTKTYLCQKLGRPAYYLRDVIKQKNAIPPEYQTILAHELGVTVEYLNDGAEQKEKPAHNVDELSDLKKQAHSLIDGISDEKLKEYMPALERILRGG